MTEDTHMLRYKEIKHALMDYIDGMSNGDKLPSRPVLSRRLDASRATIDKAIWELTEEGILESRFGSGTYVARRLEGVKRNLRNWCMIAPDTGEAIYMKIISSVVNEARERNTNVILCNSEHNTEKQSEYIKRMLMAGIDGFIIVPVMTRNVLENVELYKNLTASQIPFVFCNRDVDGVMAPIVKSNDFYGSYMATLHLLDHGYNHIAFLARNRYRTSVDRCQGYISALQSRGVEIVRKRIILLEDSTYEDCYEKFSNLLTSDTPVDAVVCFNDLIAQEAMRAVKNAGLRISDDIGIIGYDAIISEAYKIPLTTVSYRAEDIGRMAAQVLDKMIEKKERDAFGYYLVEPSIVVGKTCMGKVNAGKTGLQMR